MSFQHSTNIWEQYFRHFKNGSCSNIVLLSHKVGRISSTLESCWIHIHTACQPCPNIFLYKIYPALPLKDITIYHLCKISKRGTRFLCQRLFGVYWSCSKSLSKFSPHNFCSITRSLKQTEFTSNDESWCPWTFKKCMAHKLQNSINYL